MEVDMTTPTLLRMMSLMSKLRPNIGCSSSITRDVTTPIRRVRVHIDDAGQQRDGKRLQKVAVICIKEKVLEGHISWQVHFGLLSPEYRKRV